MKMFLKSLLVSFGLLFSPVIQTGDHTEPREHQAQEESYTALRLDQQAEALQLERLAQQAEYLRLERLAQQGEHSQNHSISAHHTQEPITLLHKGDGHTITSNDGLTAAEERAALNAKEHLSFIHESTTHITDHHAQLNFIRTKIIQHLTNELSTIKSKLTAEQIKNREMVIKFFDKAGELTTEGLAKFHNIYKKLAKWEKGTELTLTPEEQKEMKLFLQSLIRTYCVKHQTLEKAA